MAGEIRQSKYKFKVASLAKERIIVDQVMAIQILMNLLIFNFKVLSVEDSTITLDITTKEGGIYA